MYGASLHHMVGCIDGCADKPPYNWKETSTHMKNKINCAKNNRNLTKLNYPDFEEDKCFIPLIKNKKRSKIKEWQNKDNRYTYNEIVDYLQHNPYSDVGFLSDDIIVFDIDLPKELKNTDEGKRLSLETAELIQKNHGKTLIKQTPTYGLHIYYYCAEHDYKLVTKRDINGCVVELRSGYNNKKYVVYNYPILNDDAINDDTAAINDDAVINSLNRITVNELIIHGYGEPSPHHTNTNHPKNNNIGDGIIGINIDQLTDVEYLDNHQALVPEIWDDAISIVKHDKETNEENREIFTHPDGNWMRTTIIDGQYPAIVFNEDNNRKPLIYKNKKHLVDNLTLKIDKDYDEQYALIVNKAEYRVNYEKHVKKADLIKYIKIIALVNNIVQMNNNYYVVRNVNEKIATLSMLNKLNFKLAISKSIMNTEISLNKIEELLYIYIPRVYRRWNDIGFRNGVLRIVNKNQYKFIRLSDITKKSLIPRLYYDFEWEHIDNANTVDNALKEATLNSCSDLIGENVYNKELYGLGWLFCSNNGLGEEIMVYQGEPGSGKTIREKFITNIMNKAGGSVGYYDISPSGEDAKKEVWVNNEIAIINEMDSWGLKRATSMLKIISGGSDFSLRKFGSRDFIHAEKRETAKAIIITNRNLMWDEALKQRLIPVTFTVTHRNTTHDNKNLLDDLMKDEEQIIKLAINHYLNIGKEALIHGETDVKTKNEYIEDYCYVDYDDDIEIFKETIKEHIKEFKNKNKKNNYNLNEYEEQIENYIYDEGYIVLEKLNKDWRKFAEQHEIPKESNITLRTLKKMFRVNSLNKVRFYINKNPRRLISIITGLRAN